MPVFFSDHLSPARRPPRLADSCATMSASSRQDEFERVVLSHYAKLAPRGPAPDPGTRRGGRSRPGKYCCGPGGASIISRAGTNAKAWLFRILLNAYYGRGRRVRALPPMVELEAAERELGSSFSSAGIAERVRGNFAGARYAKRGASRCRALGCGRRLHVSGSLWNYRCTDRHRDVAAEPGAPIVARKTHTAGASTRNPSRKRSVRGEASVRTEAGFEPKRKELR